MKKKWPIWKTIKVGTHENPNSLRHVLKASRVRIIKDGANYLLNKINPAKRIKELKLVRIKASELGVKKATKYDEVRKIALLSGLSLCPLYIAGGEWCVRRIVK